MLQRAIGGAPSQEWQLRQLSAMHPTPTVSPTDTPCTSAPISLTVPTISCRHHGEYATAEFVTGRNEIGVTDAAELQIQPHIPRSQRAALNAGAAQVGARFFELIGHGNGGSPYYFGL